MRGVPVRGEGPATAAAAPSGNGRDRVGQVTVNGPVTAPLLVFTQTRPGFGGTFVRTRASNAPPAAGAADVTGTFAIPASGAAVGFATGSTPYTLTVPVVAEVVPTTRKSVVSYLAAIPEWF